MSDETLTYAANDGTTGLYLGSGDHNGSIVMLGTGADKLMGTDCDLQFAAGTGPILPKTGGGFARLVVAADNSISAVTV